MTGITTTASTVAAPATPAAEAPGAGGYVVGVDPVTKELTTPSSSEILALIGKDPERRALTTPLVERFGAKGGAVVRLNGRFRHFMTIQVGEDARLHSGCAQEEEAAHVAR